jgi:hypothetical protein
MIIMQYGIPGNTPDRPRYEFKVDVYDSHWKIQVRSTVSVTVQTLSEEAVTNSGAIRLAGMFKNILFIFFSPPHTSLFLSLLHLYFCSC